MMEHNETSIKKTEKKGYGRIITTIWNLTGIICLLAVFSGTFLYMKDRGLIENLCLYEEEQPQKDVQKEGTYCTLKSNSLDGVPIYEEPGSTVQKGFFPEGKCCQILNMRKIDGKKWAQVSYCGLTGWVKKKQLHFISEKECYIKEGTRVFVNTVSEKGIKGYREPTVSSDIMMTGMTYGMEFDIIALQDGWGQVKKEDGTEFWVNMYHMGSYATDRWMVETLSSAQKINFRQGPGEGEKTLGKVPEGSRLIMSEYHNGWGKTVYSGKEGWVMLRYLTPVASEEKDNYRRK